MLRIFRGRVLSSMIVLFNLKKLCTLLDQTYLLLNADQNSLNAVKLLQSSCCSKHPCFNIIQEIHAVHKNDESISWKHVLREGNQVADGLTKKALSTLVDYQVYNMAPDCIIGALTADIRNVLFPRDFQSLFSFVFHPKIFFIYNKLG